MKEKIKAILINILIKLINNDFRFLEKFEAARLPSGKTIQIKREMMLTIKGTNFKSVDFQELKLEIYNHLQKYYKYLCDPINFSNYDYHNGCDIKSFRVCIPVWESLDKK